MAKRSMEEEYDNLCASVGEDLPWTEGTQETWVSTLDIQVRRADSVSVSLLSDSYSDYGWIEDFRGMHGTNYDTQTGQVLALDDVMEVNNELAQAVFKELNSHMWAGDFYADDTVEAYFANTPHEDISWTLDYNGVTFYFADGELAEAGNGRQTATVSFAEYPQLFAEKYMAVPQAYIVELPMDSSFFTDLDGNGDLEELNVTGWYNSDVGLYGSFGIYTDTDGHYHYEECYADGFCPYYVKTAEEPKHLYYDEWRKRDMYDTLDGKIYTCSLDGLDSKLIYDNNQYILRGMDFQYKNGYLVCDFGVIVEKEYKNGEIKPWLEANGGGKIVIDVKTGESAVYEKTW